MNDRPDVRLVVVDLEALKVTVREALAEVLKTGGPEFYSQESLPPGMGRRSFMDAVRRGDLPARMSGKLRIVARSDYLAFLHRAQLAPVRHPQPDPPDVNIRALVRGSQGKT